MSSDESDDSGYDSPCSKFDYDIWDQEQQFDPFQHMHQFRIDVALIKHDRCIRKRIVAIDPDWRVAIGSVRIMKPVAKNGIIQVRRTTKTPAVQRVEDAQPIDTIRGLLTGMRNGITIIDTKRDSAFYKAIPQELLNATLRVDTPNRGVHLYFEYDFRLKSIYDTIEGVSVYNDDRYVLIGSLSYPAYNKLNPIIAMPETMFKTLHDAQVAPMQTHQDCSKLFSILDDGFFNEEYLLKKLVFTMRNEDASRDIIINTIRDAIVSRNGWYDRYAIELLLEMPLPYDITRYTFKSLKRKAIAQMGQEVFNTKMKNIQQAIETSINTYPRLRHVEGVATKLSDIKAIYPKLTARKIVALNDAFVSKQMHVCKRCGNPHHKECCDKYHYGQRSSAQFVYNLEIQKC